MREVDRRIAIHIHLYLQVSSHGKTIVQRGPSRQTALLRYTGDKAINTLNITRFIMFCL